MKSKPCLLIDLSPTYLPTNPAVEAIYPGYEVDLPMSEKIACNVTAAPFTGYTDEELFTLSHLLYIERITSFSHSCVEGDEIIDPDFGNKEQ